MRVATRRVDVNVVPLPLGGRKQKLRRFAFGLVLVAAVGLGGACDDNGAESGDSDGVLAAAILEDALLVEGSMVAGAEVGAEDWAGFADDRVAQPDSCQPLSAIIELDTEPDRAERVQVDVPQWGPGSMYSC